MLTKDSKVINIYTKECLKCSIKARLKFCPECGFEMSQPSSFSDNDMNGFPIAEQFTQEVLGHHIPLYLLI